MKKLILIFIILTTCSLSRVFSQTYVVIVNSSNTISTLTKKDLSDIFLKKKTRWESGNNITPVDLAPGSPVREDFSNRVHGKSVAAIRSFWQQAVFSGNASAPIEKSGENDVIEFVRKNPGAIGYVSSGSNLSGLKQVVLK